jgi:putative transcriptional regulator
VTIRHHPNQATLLDYAAGALPQALAIVAATHLASCSACQDTLATLEATAGVMLDDIEPVPVGDDALANLLKRVDAPPPVQPPLLNPELPAPLNRVPLGRWWPIGIGVRWRPLKTTGRAWAGLILAQPGRKLPSHGHAGQELTCVLSGAFVDASGEYRQGDLADPDFDHDQAPEVLGSQPCLCVLASEGMRLHGILGLAQRMIGQ